MKTILEGLNYLDISKIEHLNAEVIYLQNTLEILRATGEISNDAFLDAGIIQGGLSLISNLLTQGVTSEEAGLQLKRLKEKVSSLMNNYPDLDVLIESKR
ncbi:MAG: hypothetical protein ACKVI6_04800 [Candidatus Poseidoniales archaeon]|jgi:hypothetical protein|tara:strand:+ start:200 stop:499 length:300 start_codon:yes stop_codon:yes gene_type:complete